MAALAHMQTANPLTQQLHVALDTGLTASQVEENQRKYGKNGACGLYKLILTVADNDSFRRIPVPTPLPIQLPSLRAYSASGRAFSITPESCLSWRTSRRVRTRRPAYVKPIVILAILIANAWVGVVQETNAEKAIEALMEYSPDEAKVIRDGRVQKIHAVDLVLSDVISLVVGDKVPTDSCIISISSASFTVDQVPLTGESYSNPWVAKRLLYGMAVIAAGVASRTQAVFVPGLCPQPSTPLYSTFTLFLCSLITSSLFSRLHLPSLGIQHANHCYCNLRRNCSLRGRGFSQAGGLPRMQAQERALFGDTDAENSLSLTGSPFLRGRPLRPSQTPLLQPSSASLCSVSCTQREVCREYSLCVEEVWSRLNELKLACFLGQQEERAQEECSGWAVKVVKGNLGSWDGNWGLGREQQEDKGKLASFQLGLIESSEVCALKQGMNAGSTHLRSASQEQYRRSLKAVSPSSLSQTLAQKQGRRDWASSRALQAADLILPLAGSTSSVLAGARASRASEHIFPDLASLSG
ncbi:RHTO0S07e02190g1_1 [Rhodotorula toruloides]|uniref:RHTO0S07e02190g1_1 n=2 Tax=Rhodotorula toruloides TaxID=5286 RepID=A0A061B6U4_RHOTO|nr:calcium-transporting ATPase [Rhodotorula toruloides NP11]EMS25035.1 calcium-transporting ATPase [Rhodotorula toruloides NP11]CDR42614.1 RHTO0S07e02190g1_1 [Rhodotorula toruloides]